jgi:hypothetical protein
MDYSVRVLPNHYRFEVRDTDHDIAPGDPTTKRRAVLSASTSADYFKNGETYALSFEARVHWDTPGDQLLVGDGHQIMEMHTGSHPAFAIRLDKSRKLQITTATDSNKVRYLSPTPLDEEWHKFALRFCLGTNSFVQVAMDGVDLGTFSGGVGNATEDNHKAKFGIYAASGLGGNRIVAEIAEISPFPVVTNG